MQDTTRSPLSRAATRHTGIGWRQPHYAQVLTELPRVAFLEVHSENFFAPGGAALAVLTAGRTHYPVSLHGVGLSLGSAVGLDSWHLDQLARLVERVEPVRVSDHASFARGAWQPPGQTPAISRAVHAADLLPVPWTNEALTVMAANVQRVQERLGRTIAVENLSAYLQWKDADWSEPAFLAELSRRTGCQLLVDVNNLMVNARNRHLANPAVTDTRLVADCCQWLNDLTRALGPVSTGPGLAHPAIAEIHLAGHTHAGDIVIDDHGSRVSDPVWAVYAHAIASWGPVPSLIEWDTDIPELGVLLQEAQLADGLADRLASQVPCNVRATRPPPTRPHHYTPMHTLEAQQSALLQALFAPKTQKPSDSIPSELQNFIAETTYPTSGRGLNCYKSNAHALAERALFAAYPVVTAILSADSMSQLARALWHTHPPLRGDMALWGDSLPTFVAASPQLADLPWLADVARVEWALHQADAAEDVAPDLPSLALLAEDDPAHLTLCLAPGLQVLRSQWAVVHLLHAHRAPSDTERSEAVASLGNDWCSPGAEHVLVWRIGHRPASLAAITAEEAVFVTALLAGQPLLAALESCELDLGTWLPHAVQQGRVLGVRPCEGTPSGC